jgi:hypothetical protein
VQRSNRAAKLHTSTREEKIKSFTCVIESADVTVDLGSMYVSSGFVCTYCYQCQRSEEVVIVRWPFSTSIETLESKVRTLFIVKKKGGANDFVRLATLNI